MARRPARPGWPSLGAAELAAPRWWPAPEVTTASRPWRTPVEAAPFVPATLTRLAGELGGALASPRRPAPWAETDLSLVAPVAPQAPTAPARRATPAASPAPTAPAQRGQASTVPSGPPRRRSACRRSPARSSRPRPRPQRPGR
ncbi:MAG: hypothetical protein R3F43_20480 [bacterium]